MASLNENMDDSGAVSEYLEKCLFPTLISFSVPIESSTAMNTMATDTDPYDLVANDSKLATSNINDVQLTKDTFRDSCPTGVHGENFRGTNDPINLEDYYKTCDSYFIQHCHLSNTNHHSDDMVAVGWVKPFFCLESEEC
jgi:hypothetical protein